MLQDERAYIDKLFFADARSMSSLPDNSVQLIVTSPPYFNIKDFGPTHFAYFGRKLPLLIPPYL